MSCLFLMFSCVIVSCVALQDCLYGEGKVVPPVSDGGYEPASYFTNPSTSHSAGRRAIVRVTLGGWINAYPPFKQTFGKLKANSCIFLVQQSVSETKQMTEFPVFLLSGFDLLQDLQGQAGGGYSMSACPDDSFLFQAGGVDRCLSQIYSIYLDSWSEAWSKKTKALP